MGYFYHLFLNIQHLCGSLTNLIAQQGYEVIGVEDSKSGVRLAQEKFTDCRFIQGSIYDLPYTEMGGQFDIIISCEVIEHLFYPKELVRNTKQLLKPNGRLILTTPYHGYLKNLALAISGKMDKHFTALWDGGHIKFFSVVTMKSLLISEGYEDIKFKFAGGIPYLSKSMLCSSTLK
ncbi:class I SAM-dependent methyltransferase [Umezakia ovalisporum]|uniref:class I SAM-dependent methyltransferase n=1 Tax=Umezakia ovalisporum TaxID=75695 RepID=UPI0028CB6180|nr:class I SAM-dependent methyltransferase [Umezakia ovalisporum]